jgi:PKD domain
MLRKHEPIAADQSRILTPVVSVTTIDHKPKLFREAKERRSTMSTLARRPIHETSRTSREEGAVSRAGALFVSLALVAALAWAGAAAAQLPLTAVGSQFDVTGFIQKATLDAPGDVLAGGTVQVNGQTIIVPRNTIFQMPAFALTWQQLFAMAPAPYGPTQTGLAMLDVPAPLTTYEVHVQGNRIGDAYIAGLLFMSQQSLNMGQGFINYMDYANNEMRVGGVIGDPTTGTRVKVNDPSGRFAPVYSLDPRFTLDSDNPTVRTETGYPMCFPHVNPATADDPLCPQRNRPIDAGTGFPLTIFTMQDPATAPLMALPAQGPANGTNPFIAAPFEVGDLVAYSGNLFKDGTQPSAGPLPAAGWSATYIAAHTIIGSVGIYTAPGTNPAYVATDVMLLGVGGLPIAGIAQEATVRTRFEGFTTDASSGLARTITLWGIDVDSCTPATSDRNWGSIDIDQGPPKGAVKGRWRFRPPRTVLSMPAAGTFLPATRMMRSVLTGAYTAAAPVISNNGLITGQYAAPIFTFLFPENLLTGGPPVPVNFQDFPFLLNGTFAALPGLNVGQLVPFPEATVVAPLCGVPPNPTPPTANAGAAQTVTVGTVVTLNGSASTDPNGLAIAWVWTPDPAITLNSNFVSNPSFTATTAGTYTFSLTVTNTVGLSSAPSFVTITVNPANATLAPTANAGVAQTVAAGTAIQLNGLASSDPNVPAQALTYAWTQTAGTPVTLSSAAAATPTFTAPTPFPAATTLTFSLTVTNTSLLSSAPSTVNVTVNPVGAPVANAGANQSKNPGLLVTLNGSASFDPAGLPLTYLWAQVSGLPVVLSSTTAVSPTFTAPASGALGFTLVVNNGFVSSVAAITTVTVNTAGPDTIQFTVVEYRIGKQRLTVTASDSITDGTPILSLMGYGGPSGLVMPFAGGGLYTIILTGVPQPASVTVNSSLGGTATSPILKVRP